MLAEAGALDPKRGDVVLFANTSAEHPGTWDFAAECSDRFERAYGLPCFWYEFCTVEDASRGLYRRRLSYRLVNRQPYDAETNPTGYRSRGEVFEEMLSFQGLLPNPHSRTCTTKLKLYPAHLLLSEWLGGAEGPSHDGHFAADAYLTPSAAARQYVANRGTAEPEVYKSRVEVMTERPPNRTAQLWSDFTAAQIPARPFVGPAGQAPLWGPDAAQFVTILGLRADEPRRVDRVLSRSLFAEGAGGRECSIRTQPPGERPYFPLYDSGLAQEDIDAYWDAQDFHLEIPEGAGNCVFCFMKGTRQLRRQSLDADPQRVTGAPSDIRWWDDMELKYRREQPSSRGPGISKFGFLGVGGPTFADIADPDAPLQRRYATGAPSCDCTD